MRAADLPPADGVPSANRRRRLVFAWTDWPKVPGDDPDPAVRVLTRCEAQYHRSCALYAVDDVVVYRKPGRKGRP